MLLEAEDKHFAWMLGGPIPESGLRLPADGVDAPSVLEIIRRMAVAVRATYGAGSWMIVVDGEVVGMCSYKGAPDLDGVVEIGFGVAPRCRKRGYATRAIADLLKIALQDNAIRGVVAETTPENVASQRVLERNGFVRNGKRIDPEDGEVILWQRDLSDFRQQA
jgi:RimJ/RimL family protein N-acetyltransferase